MTICLACLVDEKTIVLAADKMVSVNLPNIKFERGASKLSILANRFALASAGDALIPTEIINGAIAGIAESNTVAQAAKALKSAYVSERDRLVEELLLRPSGFTLEDIRDRQGKFRPEVLLQALQQVQNFRFDSVLLLAGVDESGAHLYTIHPPGNLRCFDALGYIAIGSGEHHALQTFITSNFDLPMSLNRAVLTAYEAKRRSEKATGVGPLTDMMVMRRDKIVKFTDAQLQQLDSVYAERVKSETDWLAKFEKADLKIL